MVDFIETLDNLEIKDNLHRLIQGKGAFRRFKDYCFDENIIQDWYKYRDERYKEIAIEWCKENLVDLIGRDKEVIFVDWNKGKESYRDIQLMSLCHYNIIANSSFSWWGAWLNNYEDKVVIAPEIWMHKPLVNDPICDSWKRISNK